MQKVKAKPFLKWAGGKGQLLGQLENHFPREVRNGKIKKYAEPFLGGGAMFFELAHSRNIESVYLSDVNRDLVLLYQVVQQKPEMLLDFLEQYQTEYDRTDEAKRNDLFLEIRRHFNSNRFEINYKRLADNWVPRAAQFIFLNKTCFNGLFRLNSKGEFNVPFGKYKTANILDAANITASSKLLEKAEIHHADFSACLDWADENTFIYFDPPYRPISQTSSFTTYAGFEFSDADQLKLAKFFRKVDAERKAKIMLSNSDPKNENPNDHFFEQAYSGYNIFRVQAYRAINSLGDKRGKISEILITNYQHEPQILAFDF